MTITSRPSQTFPGQHLLALRRDPLAFLDQLSVGDADVVHLAMGTGTVTLLRHPDDIREVLTAHYDKFTKGKATERLKLLLLGDGLLTSQGEFHLSQRRLMQPAFHRARMEGYARIMASRAEAWQDRWVTDSTLDIHQEMMALTLSIVTHALLGANAEGKYPDIRRAIDEVVHSFHVTALPFQRFLDQLPVGPTRRLNAARRALDTVIYSMIDEHRRSGKDEGDLLSMLLSAKDDESAGRRMTDEQIRDEALTIFLAGHETTANALSWTFYALAQHPDVEARLVEELRAVLGDRPPEPADVPRLPLTRRVLAESMRLFPPAWTLARRAQEDVPIGDFVIPRHTIILMSQWVVHRDGRWYPDPLRFDPDRFLPAVEAQRPRMSYFPFGAGSRICIGEHFAWTEMILVLATLVQHWHMDLVPTHKVVKQAHVTMRPRHGIRVTLRRR